MSAVGYVGRLRAEQLVRRALSNEARTFLVATVAAATAAGVLASALAPAAPVRWADFAFLVVAGSVAQLFASRIGGHQAFHTGLAFAFAAALVLPPELVVLVCVLQHLPDWVRHRWRWYVQTFNIANYVLSALAAWSVRVGFGRADWHVTGAATVSAVALALAAAAAFILVNHFLLARMLFLARGHDLSATGLFSFDGLVADAVLTSVGSLVAFLLLHGVALVPVAVLPLVLIQRSLALPTLREQAYSDHKTGLLNARGIDQPARNEFARARRLGHSLSVLLCDIDDLRGINSRHGHLEGDAALDAVARAFRNELRPYDLCARFGGDEFLVVLPETEREDAVAVAERIQAWLALHPLPTREGKVAVGMSIGAASLGEEGQIGELMARADAAMYAAKRGGGTSLLSVG